MAVRWPPMGAGADDGSRRDRCTSSHPRPRAGRCAVRLDRGRGRGDLRRAEPVGRDGPCPPDGRVHLPGGDEPARRDAEGDGGDDGPLLRPPRSLDGRGGGIDPRSPHPVRRLRGGSPGARLRGRAALPRPLGGPGRHRGDRRPARPHAGRSGREVLRPGDAPHRGELGLPRAWGGGPRRRAPRTGRPPPRVAHPSRRRRGAGPRAVRAPGRGPGGVRRRGPWRPSTAPAPGGPRPRCRCDRRSTPHRGRRQRRRLDPTAVRLGGAGGRRHPVRSQSARHGADRGPGPPGHRRHAPSSDRRCPEPLHARGPGGVGMGASRAPGRHLGRPPVLRRPLPPGQRAGRRDAGGSRGREPVATPHRPRPRR